MKLLHTGDLHLDSAYCGSDLLTAQTRRQEHREVLMRIFALAEREECDMILIAGDLFDTPFPTPDTRELLLSLLQKTRAEVFVAPGNHDPYTDGSFYKTAELPEKVHVFNSRELQCVELPRLHARVFGYAFLGGSFRESPLTEAPMPKEEGMLHILCAHGDWELPTSRYAPLTESDLIRHGFDYAALGHIHNPPETGARVRYCGFPEGRSYDEEGDGGVLLVTLTEGEMPKVERRTVSRRRFCTDTVELTGDEDAGALRTLLERLIKQYDGAEQRTNLRLYLTGACEGALLEHISATEQELKGSLEGLELVDLTMPPADGRALAADISLKGYFYRALLPSLNSPSPQVRSRALTALRMGLAAMEGRPIPERRDRG